MLGAKRFCFICSLFLVIFLLGACEEIDTREEDRWIEPVSYRITGYVRNNEEINFTYGNCNGIYCDEISGAGGEYIFKDVMLKPEEYWRDINTRYFIDLTIIKTGTTKLQIWKWVESEEHVSTSVKSGLLSVTCSVDGGKINVSATFDDFPCIMTQLN